MTSLPAPLTGGLPDLPGLTVVPTTDAPPGVTHMDVRLPNGWGLSVARSAHHYSGESTAEIAVIHDDGSGSWPLDHDSAVAERINGHPGAVIGWADRDMIARVLTELSTLAHP